MEIDKRTIQKLIADKDEMIRLLWLEKITLESMIHKPIQRKETKIPTLAELGIK